jgi:hypothetical protein
MKRASLGALTVAGCTFLTPQPSISSNATCKLAASLKATGLIGGNAGDRGRDMSQTGTSSSASPWGPFWKTAGLIRLCTRIEKGRLESRPRMGLDEWQEKTVRAKGSDAGGTTASSLWFHGTVKRADGIFRWLVRRTGLWRFEGWESCSGNANAAEGFASVPRGTRPMILGEVGSRAGLVGLGMQREEPWGSKPNAWRRREAWRGTRRA